MIYHVYSVCRLSFCINTDIYRRGSIQRQTTNHGYIEHNAGQASAAASTSNLHSRVVGPDGTLLGPEP